MIESLIIEQEMQRQFHQLAKETHRSGFSSARSEKNALTSFSLANSPRLAGAIVIAPKAGNSLNSCELEL